MQFEQIKSYPVIDIDVVIITVNACTYLNLSEIAHDDMTSYRSLGFEFDADVAQLDVVRSRKFQLYIYTDNPDVTYDLMTVTCTDADNHTNIKGVPLICQTHILNVGQGFVGREILLTDLIELDNYYEGFQLDGCLVKGNNPNKYTNEIFQILPDRIKIIGEVDVNYKYALVNNRQRRAMVLSFTE